MPRRIAVLVCTLACLLAPRAHAADEPAGARALVDVARDKKLLIHTRQDRWLRGKPQAVEGDSLVVKDGNEMKRIALGDIAGAWRSRPDPVRGALIAGVRGVVGGAFLEVALGSECPDCALDAGDILEGAAIGGGFGAASGALGGLLFGGAWTQLVPKGEDAEPYTPWGASAGASWSRELRFKQSRVVEARIASWSLGTGTASTGVEYGSLPGSSSQDVRDVFAFDSTGGGGLVPTGETIHSDEEDRWAFATSQVRWRARSGSARPQFTLGVGSYFLRNAGTSVRRDSLGTVVSVRHGSGTERNLGINAGFGVSFGSGQARPGVDARLHWVFSEVRRTWATIGVFTDWR
jgi:hypothetical protein